MLLRVTMVGHVFLKIRLAMLVTVHLVSMAPIVNWTSMSVMRTAMKEVIIVPLVFCVSISDVSLRLHQFSLLRKVSVTFYTYSRDNLQVVIVLPFLFLLLLSSPLQKKVCL